MNGSLTFMAAGSPPGHSPGYTWPVPPCPIRMSSSYPPSRRGRRG